MRYTEIPIRFSCFDSETENILYRHDDAFAQIKCDKCLHERTEAKNVKCNKECFLLSESIHENKMLFQFCMPKICSAKEARVRAGIIIRSFLATETYRDHLATKHNESLSHVLHDTQHINANMNTVLLSLFNEEELSNASDKIEHIKSKILNNENEISKVLLKTIQMVQHNIVEYFLVDTMQPGYKLPEGSLGKHRIHSLFMMNFYLFELQMKEKNIYCRTARTEHVCHADFMTAKTAVFQLLHNCIKYTKPATDIEVAFELSEKHVEIVIRTQGLQFSPDEAKGFLLAKTRGANAKKYFPNDGKGIGMSIINHMMNLNGGYFRYQCNETMSTIVDGKPFSPCEFRLGFQRYAKTNK